MPSEEKYRTLNDGRPLKLSLLEEMSYEPIARARLAGHATRRARPGHSHAQPEPGHHPGSRPRADESLPRRKPTDSPARCRHRRPEQDQRPDLAGPDRADGSGLSTAGQLSTQTGRPRRIGVRPQSLGRSHRGLPPYNLRALTPAATNKAASTANIGSQPACSQIYPAA